MPFDATDFNGSGGSPQHRRRSFRGSLLKEAGLQILAVCAASGVAHFCCNAIDNFPPAAPIGQPCANSVLGQTVGLITFFLLMSVYLLLRVEHLMANDLDMIWPDQ